MHRELLNSNTKMDDLVTRMIDAQTNMNQALLAQLMEVKKEDSLIEKVEKEIECENEKQETLAKVSKNITLDGKWTIIKKVIPYILAIGYAVYDLFLSKGG